MIEIRPSNQRGAGDHGWLQTRHSFSFADYYDPAFMGFGPLRVINEDHIAPGAGFGAHPHADMEIITYVLSGALAHRDSLGNGSVIRPGEVQRMSAGTGITHSEFNGSETDPVHLLQIWLLPERGGIAPGYEQKAFSKRQRQDQLCLVADRDGRGGALTIHQDVALHACLLGRGKTVTHRFGPGRIGWLQIASGRIGAGGKTLKAGDGAAIAGEDAVTLSAEEDSEFLLFDMTGGG